MRIFSFRLGGRVPPSSCHTGIRDARGSAARSGYRQWQALQRVSRSSGLIVGADDLVTPRKSNGSFMTAFRHHTPLLKHRVVGACHRMCAEFSRPWPPSRAPYCPCIVPLDPDSDTNICRPRSDLQRRPDFHRLDGTQSRHSVAGTSPDCQRINPPLRVQPGVSQFRSPWACPTSVPFQSVHREPL